MGMSKIWIISNLCPTLFLAHVFLLESDYVKRGIVHLDYLCEVRILIIHGKRETVKDGVEENLRLVRWGNREGYWRPFH